MATERDEAHKQVLSALNAACEVYAMEAQATSAKYYEKALARAEASSSDPKKKFVPFVILIRRKEPTSTTSLSIEILWARRFPMKQDGRIRLMTSAIAKGKHNHYSRRSIGSGPAWFEELFPEYEPRLTALRSLIKANRQARQTLNKNHRANSYYSVNSLIQ